MGGSHVHSQVSTRPPAELSSWTPPTPGRKQLTHTSASPRLEATRLEPRTYKNQALEPSEEEAPPLWP